MTHSISEESSDALIAELTARGYDISERKLEEPLGDLTTVRDAEGDMWIRLPDNHRSSSSRGNWHCIPLGQLGIDWNNVLGYGPITIVE